MLKTGRAPLPGAAALDGGGDSNDLHLKMSKKIAQLTKVIYHLNTKNEDHMSEVKGLQQSYETEIDQILKDAYAKMTKFQDQVQRQFDRTAFEKKLAEVEHVRAQENAAMKAALVDTLAKAKERETAIQNDAVAKIESIKNGVRKAKKDFALRVKELEKAVQKVERHSEAKIAEVREKCKVEVESVVTSSNENYNAMLAERCRAEDQLRACLAKERARALDELRQENERVLRAAEADRAAQLADKDAQISGLRSQLAAYKAMMTADLSKANDEVRQLAASFDGERAEHRRALTERSKTISDLEAKVAVLQDDCAKRDATVLETRERLATRDREYEIVLGQLADERISSSKALEAASSARTATERELRRQLEAVQTELADRVDDLRKANENVAGLQRDLSARSQEIDQLAQQLDAVKRQLMAAVATTTALEKERDELQAGLARERAEWQWARHQMQDELRRSEEEWAANLARQCESIKQRAGDDLRAQQSAMEARQRQLDDAVNAERAKADAMKADMERDLQERVAEWSTAKEKLGREVTMLRNVIQERDRRLVDEGDRRVAAERQWQARLVDEEQRGKRALAEAVESERAKARSAFSAAQDRWEADRLDLIQHLSQNANTTLDAAKRSIDELEQELVVSRRELDAMQNDLGQERALRAQAEGDARDVAERYRAAQSALDSSVQDREERLRKMADAHEAALHEAARANNAIVLETVAERDRVVLELKAAHDMAGRRLLAEHASALEMERERAQQALQDAIVKERQASQLEMAAQLGRQRGELERAMQDMGRLHEERLRLAAKQASSETKAALEKCKVDFEMQLDEERARHRAELSKADGAHRREMDGLRAEIGRRDERMEEIILSSKSKVDEVSAMLEAKKIELGRARTNIEQLQHQVQDLEDRGRDAAFRSAASIERLEREHRQALQARQAEFDHEKEQLEGELYNVRRRIDAIETRFRNRESRREDVERIQELEKLSAHQQEVVDQVMSDMKLFKLELANREKNYNERFGANPRVGVMQVVKTNKQRGGGARPNARPDLPPLAPGATVTDRRGSR
ncbi:Protein FAM184A/B N-terminal domain-containing protein [Plasmodiophora brassicae]